MSRDISPFGVRIPADLKARIEESAAKNKRSINAEVVMRLGESFESTNGALAEFTDGELIKELLARYRRGEIYIRIGKWDESGI